MGRRTKLQEYELNFWHGQPLAKGPNAESGKKMLEAADVVLKMNGTRIDKMRENIGVYRDSAVSSFDSGNLHLHRKGGKPLKYNVTKSCTDTVVAKLGLHEPSPSFSTFGAAEGQQEKARGMEKAAVGVLQNQKGWHTGLMALKDACLCPIGIIKTFDLDDDVMVKRMHPSKVLWDIEAVVDNQRPSVFFEFDEKPRGGLIKQFPDFANELADSPAVPDKGRSGDKRVRDMVRVVEAFKEGTSKDPNSGRHTIAVGNCTLLDERWPYPAPYEFTRWTDDQVGFDGISIAHELQGIQDEIDFVLKCLQGNHAQLAVSYYLKPKGAEVDDEAFLTNERFRKVEYLGGVAPNIVHPQIASQQVFDYLERLYQRAFELVGLSQLSATSKKPADLESGAALRAYLDVETVRFSVAQRAWEQLFVDVSWQIVRCCKRLAQKKKGWSTTYFNKRDKVLQKVVWSEVDLPEDKFQIRVYPMSALPLTPAARLSKAAEMRRDQVITHEQFNLLADMPDMEKLQRLQVAPYEDLERIFERMLDPKGDYIKPLEFTRVDIGIPLCHSYYSRAACDGAPRNILERFETWMVDAHQVQQDQLQAQLALQQLQQQLQMAAQQAAAVQQQPQGPMPGPMPQPEPGAQPPAGPM